MSKNGRIELCRYYKGEDTNPFKRSDIRSTFWEVEQMYVMTDPSNEIFNNECRMEFGYDFPTLLCEITNDVPLGIKAFLYANYSRTGGSKDGFPGVLSSYILDTP